MANEQGTGPEPGLLGTFQPPPGLGFSELEGRGDADTECEDSTCTHTQTHVPHRLCQGFGGIFRHKDMAGKPVVSRVLSDKPKVPVEGRHL